MSTIRWEWKREGRGAEAIDAIAPGSGLNFISIKKKELKFAKVVKWIHETSFTNNAYILIVRPNLLVYYDEYPPLRRRYIPN